MTLDEAAALFWPDGPLTVRSLRTAIRDGRLPVSVVAGRHLVTKLALKEMSKCTLLPRLDPARSQDNPASADRGAVSCEAAYEKLMRTLGDG